MKYSHGTEALLSLASTPMKTYQPVRQKIGPFFAAKGFGGGGGGGFGESGAKKKKKRSTKKKGNRLTDSIADQPRRPVARKTQTYVKSEQNALIEELAVMSSRTCIGRAVNEVKHAMHSIGDRTEIDPFWDLIPSLISSKFSNINDAELERVAGMVKHALHPDKNSLLDKSIINDKWRPHDEIHAYMPNLGETKPFWDASELSICKQLSDNYEIICDEYEALLKDRKDRFQSVTTMNYDSGWKTMVLFYNGHRIPDFPYHLCPKTIELMESLPLAGRIAGFNRQRPSSGIPLHSDGNNMWLTLQMGIYVPDDEKAWIRVGPETRRWTEGECILYDTTYEHETSNESETQERVVLHIDFFNTLKMTPVEIEVMRYIYGLREEFMKAEGVSKVGNQVL
eukprot:CAMPEP_0197188018 /NCGR_PEP_ID=MMETSP1423-20130617/17046_1 /TAXON_ID=476441 /ORGANISM="Pseudo-nitzschia heimii, Strain UNC1101" /LENGTH=395 /DNA_ID=CAMNT_0042639753 /DNA_START=110 /DNA_END=1297 /DNA_ORIENTATION=+